METFKKWSECLNNEPVIKVGNITLKILSEHGRHLVVWMEDKMIDESKSYRADDMEDALDAMCEMQYYLQKSQQ